MAVNRPIDRVGQSAYKNINKRFSLVPNRKISIWKSLSLITFVAGLMTASVWFVSYRVEQDQFVINTKMFSQAKSDDKVNKGGIVGRADDHILVKFKKDVSSEKKQAVLDKQGLKEKSEIKQIGVKLVNIPAGKTPEEVVKKILDEDVSSVEYAEVDGKVAPDYMPNDPSLSSEWHIAKINAPVAWDSGKGAGVTIAILDSGVDCVHPDLAANCVAGWNVVSNNGDTSSIHPHGTYVAGTAAAVGDNANQMAGVSYASKIMPIRITNDTTGWAYWSDIANGVLWASDHGARIVSNSYQSHLGSSVQSAASYLNSRGGLMFNSAGNDAVLQSDFNPASIITVSATDSTDTKASWSNFGTPVDLSAPGVGVTCTIPGGGIGSCSGTSFSAPIVAGTAALIWSVKPSLTPSQVESILKSTAMDLGATGRDDYYGYGRVDAAAAVAAALNTSDPAPDTSAPTSPTNLTATPSGTSAALAWTASTDNVGVTGYTIYRDNVQIATSTKTNYTDTTVTTGTTYVYAVKAVDAAGNASAFSNTVTITLPTPTTNLVISSISAVSKTASTVTINWTTNFPSTGTVKYGTNSNTLTSSVAETSGTTTHSVTLTGLTKKTRYYYQVNAVTADGKSAISSISNVMTKPR